MKINQFIFFLLVFCSTKALTQSVEVIPFRTTGLDCDWDKSGSNRIVYSMKGDDKFYDIYLTLPDNSKDTCITCNHPNLPNKHISNPGWHPNGKWVTAVVEKAKHPRGSANALPGFGAYCDIYLISANGKKAHKLVDIENTYDHGVIAPRLSPNGKKLIWTDRIVRPNFFSLKRMAGYWQIKTADLYWEKTNLNDSIPKIKNIKILQPGKKCFYECYGYSPDGNRIIFCSSMNKPSFWDQHIYTMDTSGNDVKKLTDSDYNEHGCYAPDGKKIVWMTSTKSTKKGTDWWIMNVDGTNKTRLTFFNEPKDAMYAGKANWAGLVSFNAAGTMFVGGVQISLVTQEGRIVICRLKE